MPNNTIGEAYIQIKPSMEGVSGEIEKAMGGAGAAGSDALFIQKARLSEMHMHITKTG